MKIDKVEYVPSNMKVVDEALKLGGIKAGEDVFMEPGCGDRRALIASVLPPYNAKYAVGIEVNPIMAEITLDNIKRLNLQDKVEIIRENLFEQDFSEADVLFTYLGRLNEKLKPKLKKELKSEARVVSHSFEMEKWKPLRIKKINAPLGDDKEHPYPRCIYLYRMDKIY